MVCRLQASQGQGTDLPLVPSGFATALLHRRIDPITVAKLGGWKSLQHAFQTYGHAMDDDTLADLIIDTPATRSKKKAAKAFLKSEC